LTLASIDVAVSAVHSNSSTKPTTTSLRKKTTHRHKASSNEPAEHIDKAHKHIEEAIHLVE
jgi:hypothetical protein